MARGINAPGINTPGINVPRIKAPGMNCPMLINDVNNALALFLSNNAFTVFQNLNGLTKN